MPKAPLCLPYPAMVELCHRTVGGRRLLRPVPALTALVLGVIGRALQLFPLSLHAFVYLSNHAHFLLSVQSADILAGFQCHLKRNTALIAKEFVPWQGSVWTKSKPIPVLDDVASVERLKYVLSNSVKEGLVATPLAWPGATGAAALLEGRPIEATWVSRQTPGRAGSRLVAEPCPFELTRLPCWRDLTAAEHRARIADMFADIVEAADRERCGRPPLGVAGVLAADPTEVVELDRRPAPICHTTDPQLRARFIAEQAERIGAFRSSSLRFRAAPPGTAFPANSFPPSPGYAGADGDA